MAANGPMEKTPQLILDPQAIARPCAVSTATPADRLGAMRKPFTATMSDPQLVTGARAAFLDINPIAGDRISGPDREVDATPPSVVADARHTIGN